MDKQIRPSDNGRAWVEIDLSALAHNAAEILSHLPEGCKIMAIVKSDAYGHGMEQCALRLRQEGITTFAVATVVEGVRLRESGIDAEILVLGYTHPKDARFLHDYSLLQVVVDGEHAKALNEMGYRLNVHIAIDTGMHRLGIRADNFNEVESVYSCKNLTVEGLATHLAAADSLCEDDVAFTKLQVDNYNSIVSELKSKGYNVGKLHAQASCGIFNLKELQYDFVRPGIALFDRLSTTDDLRVIPRLEPVLSLKALIAQVRWIPAKESVSYGRIFTTKQPTKIATCCIGYADGVPRQMSGNGGMCIINGHKVPIVGRICMDMLMLDVTDVDDVKAGDVATLIGRDGDEEISCEDFAAASGTITNDILCRLGGRLPRIYNN